IGTLGSNGAYTSDVTVTLTATDDRGGAGVQRINYRATGAQPFACTTVFSAAAAINLTTNGQTTITFFATDNAGNAEAPQELTIAIDKTAPSAPTGSVSINNGDACTKSPTVTLTLSASAGVTEMQFSTDGTTF